MRDKSLAEMRKSASGETRVENKHFSKRGWTYNQNKLAREPLIIGIAETTHTVSLSLFFTKTITDVVGRW